MPSRENLVHSPLVVGTVHSPAALQRALKLKPGEVDLLELRVDAFASDPGVLERAVPRFTAPLLLTVRHPMEGGGGGLKVAERRVLIRQFLPFCSWIDLEVRSLRFFEEEVAEVGSRGVRLIVSDHYFKGTPSLARLRERARIAARAGADVFKLAALAAKVEDLERLLVFLREGRPGTRAVMGMGEYGQVSRLVLGRCGSVLNYGYLGELQVRGQWEATELKRRLGELFP